jgi:hypothetical protein
MLTLTGYFVLFIGWFSPAPWQRRLVFNGNRRTDGVRQSNTPHNDASDTNAPQTGAQQAPGTAPSTS